MMTSFRMSLALTLALIVTTPYLAAAQVNVQLSGTIESIDGPTLTLLTAAPPRRVTLGSPPPAPRPKLVVDLGEVPASQWVFLRPGERIAVVGLPSADGLRFAAIAVLGGAGPSRARETPQAP